MTFLLIYVIAGSIVAAYTSHLLNKLEMEDDAEARVLKQELDNYGAVTKNPKATVIASAFLFWPIVVAGYIKVTIAGK